jgi:hypothetical protein
VSWPLLGTVVYTVESLNGYCSAGERLWTVYLRPSVPGHSVTPLINAGPQGLSTIAVDQRTLADNAAAVPRRTLSACPGSIVCVCAGATHLTSSHPIHPGDVPYRLLCYTGQRRDTPSLDHTCPGLYIMKVLSDETRGYQAEVYFSLAAVVQGVTLAALGSELVSALRSWHFPDSIWILVTGSQSLLLCVTFWYSFVVAYFSGFRLSEFNATNHFVLAASYFVIGLLQLIAIQFLAEPRIWLTMILLLLGVTLFCFWYTSQRVRVVQPEASDRGHSEAGRLLVVLLLISLVCGIVWYSVPEIESALFKGTTLAVMGAGLLLLNVKLIRLFQEHLEFA